MKLAMSVDRAAIVKHRATECMTLLHRHAASSEESDKCDEVIYIMDKTVNIPLTPVRLHNSPTRRNPPIHQCQQEQANTCPDHRAGARGYPSIEPEDVSGREVQPRKHLALGQIHGPVHAHVHAVAVRTRRDRETGDDTKSE